MIENRNVCNYINSVRSLYEISHSDKVLQLASISFDVSVEEIFTTLLDGASLVIIPSQYKIDVSYIQNILTSKEITVIAAVPILFGISI